MRGHQRVAYRTLKHQIPSIKEYPNTYGHSRSNGFGAGDGFPAGVSEQLGYFGPNFQFTTPTNGVPEGGSSWILLGIALVGLSVLRWVPSRRAV
jgi:hypothetical protein